MGGGGGGMGGRVQGGAIGGGGGMGGRVQGGAIGGGGGGGLLRVGWGGGSRWGDLGGACWPKAPRGGGGGGGVVGVLGPAESPPPLDRGPVGATPCGDKGCRPLLAWVQLCHGVVRYRRGGSGLACPRGSGLFACDQRDSCLALVLGDGPCPLLGHCSEVRCHLPAAPRYHRLLFGGLGARQGCIRREGTSEAAPEAVRQAVGGGCQSGRGRLLSVTNAIDAGTCRQGDSGWA